MQYMAANISTLDDAAKARWLRQLDRATAAHEKTRRQLDELVAGAREAGLSLTMISEHSPYSREWVRRIAERVNAADAEGDTGAPE